MSSGRACRSAGRLATYIGLAIWAAVCLFPLYWLAVTSIKGEEAVADKPSYLPFLDFSPSLKAWAFVVFDPADYLPGRFLNSVIVATASTFLSVAIAALTLYAITRLHRSALGQTALLAAIFSTRLLPPVITVLPIYVMALAIGILDTRVLLIAVYTASHLPVAVWLLLPVFGRRATDPEEAAQLDGLSHIGILFTILGPMIAGSLAAVGAIVFVLCWNEYLFAAYLAGDHAMTIPSWVIGQMSIKEAQIGSEAEEWAQLSAAMVFSTVPLLILAGLVRRFFERSALGRQ